LDDYDSGMEYQSRPKMKDFAKAYREMVEDMAHRAAEGDEESQLLITEAEINEVNRRKSMEERVQGAALAQKFGNWESQRQKKIELKRMEKADPEEEELTFRPSTGRPDTEPVRTHNQFLRDQEAYVQKRR